jgi:cysteine desulfurase
MRENKLNFDSLLKNNQVKSNIYLDYQASTPLDACVLEKMLPYMTERFGNPHSSEHSFGWQADKAIEKAKHQIAEYIGALDDEIIFTSGSTESNNLAIVGIGYAAFLNKKTPRRTILVSAIEHKCVLGAARFLTKLGFNVEKIPVGTNGIIDLEKLKSLLTDDVLLVSVMATNNEIGTNQPLKEIGELCKNNGALFHTDASQGSYINLDVLENNTDFMSISGHKIYAPKGIGVLFISQNATTKPIPIINGGGQQSGYRSGTLATFLCVGIGEAAEIINNNKNSEARTLRILRQKLLDGLKSHCPKILINGDFDNRHPGNLNLLLPNTESKQLIYSVQPQVAFSTGSACSSGIIEPSHVLKAIGLSTEEAERSFRIAVGRFTDEEDIKKAIEIIGQKIK